MIYSHYEFEGDDFNQKINTLVKETYASIYNSDSLNYDRKKINYILKKLNSTDELPMRSLRDTDHPVIIGLKEDKDV